MKKFIVDPDQCGPSGIPTLAEALAAYIARDSKLFTSEFARKHRDAGFIEGFAEGRASLVATLLKQRGYLVSTEQQQRIQSRVVVEPHVDWVKRAVTVSTVEALFDESPS